MRGGEF